MEEIVGCRFSLAAAVRNRRESVKMTRKDVALLCEISSTRVQQLELGAAPRKLFKILEVLGLEMVIREKQK